MAWRRRDVFAGAGPLLSVALVGCLSDGTGESQPNSDPVSPTGPPETATTVARTGPASPESGWVKLNLVPTTPREIIARGVRTRSSFSPEQRQFLARLAREGSVTVHDIIRHSELPLHPPYLVELDGGIYLIEKRTTASREVTVYRFRIDVLEASRDDARAFAELSGVDRAIVTRGLSEEYVENGTPFTGTFTYKFEEAPPTTSWIVTADGNVFVAYEDDTLRLRSRGPDTTVQQDVRYDLTNVASDRVAAREYVVREYVQPISTGAFPAAQREILTAAITSPAGYKQTGQGSRPFRAVLDRLDDAPRVPNGGRYIQYNGTIYRVVQTGVEV